MVIKMLSFIDIELKLNSFFFPSVRLDHKRLHLKHVDVLPDYPSVTFCTTCMGRAHHLRETLKKNILDNQDYPHVDFVILDYNSRDGLKEWLFQTHGALIKSGKIKYYQTTEPRHFYFSHAKNVAHKLAIGDILCNLDVDNFTGPSFAAFLVKKFRENPHCFIHAPWNNHEGAAGRIAILRRHFLLVKGYDEKMIGFGYEDPNLIVRLINLGLESILIKEGAFLQVLQHDRAQSIINSKNKSLIISHWYNRIHSIGSCLGKFEANSGRVWGRAFVTKNSSTELIHI